VQIQEMNKVINKLKILIAKQYNSTHQVVLQNARN